MSISRKVFIGMMTFGILMGIMFPFYARCFTTYKNGMRVYFDSGCLLAGLLMGLSTYAITKILVIKEFAKLSDRLHDISEGGGDLTKRISVKSNDEIGLAAKSFNNFVAQLQNMILKISTNSKKLSSSFTTLLETTETASINSSEMSAESRNAEKTTDVINNNIHSISDDAFEISDTIANIATATEEMSAIFDGFVKGFKKESEIIITATNKTKNAKFSISELKKSADNIKNVVNLIKDITDKTNLLALNAKIEAATAGEYGKGFAVVANEVKALANQTANAANDIKLQIEDINKNVDSTVLAIEAVSSIMGDVDSISSNLTETISQQSIATNQISKSINSASELTNNMATNVHGASNEMNNVANILVKLNEKNNSVFTIINDCRNDIRSLFTVVEMLNRIVKQFKY